MLKKYKLQLLISILSIHFACNSNNLEKRNYNLSGLVYHSGPDLDSAKIEANGPCDCCASHILFLNDSQFVEISYCIENDHYYKGTYKINDSLLHMNYDNQFVIREYQIGDTTSANYTTNVSENPTNTSWTMFHLNGVLCYKTGEKHEITYSTPDKQTTMLELTTDLKKQGVWEKLNLK